MNSKNGMMFLAALLEHCGVNSASYYYDGDQFDSAFREGRRSVGLLLLSKIMSDGVLEKKYHEAVEIRNEARRHDMAQFDDFDEVLKGAF